MPANLPPQYYVAEQRYRSARGPAEKVAALQEMLSAVPKHKGTDHFRAELRARLARTLDELEQPRRGSRQAQPYAIRREGVGQAVLIGLPGSGKSQLLATLTGAPARVAPYPFTTRVPMPGMMPHQNVSIQLVDTPALTDRDVQTRLFSLLRNADLLLIVVDSSADPLSETEEVLSELDRWGYRLLGENEEADPGDHRVQKRAMLLCNKADLEGSGEAFETLKELYRSRLPMARVSAATGLGLGSLGEAIFAALGRVRVYLKRRGGEPDYADPLVLDRGSTVEQAAQQLHKDWARRLKFAQLWGSGKFEGQRVGRDYVLADGDVIELHG